MGKMEIHTSFTQRTFLQFHNIFDAFCKTLNSKISRSILPFGRYIHHKSKKRKDAAVLACTYLNKGLYTLQKHTILFMT